MPLCAVNRAAASPRWTWYSWVALSYYLAVRSVSVPMKRTILVAVFSTGPSMQCMVAPVLLEIPPNLFSQFVEM
jgi:hypothetical protein